MKGTFVRKILVHPMQYRIMAATVFHSVLVVVVFVAALLWPLVIQIGSDGEYNEQALAAAHQFMTLPHRIWLPLLFLLALMVLHSVLLSHKVAGPLFRLRREFRVIGSGDIGRTIKIRKRDYLHQEAEALNDMLMSLRGKVERADRGFREASAALARVHNASESSDRAEFDAAMVQARASLAEAAESLSSFNIGRGACKNYTQPAETVARPV